jgi:Rrf2 family transcriptional regulator, nitric oxide-sensitive transcriptional repressor
MFSQTTENARRAETHPARPHNLQTPTTAQISLTTRISGNYFAKVFRSQSRASLAHSLRCPGRGHKLARDPAELTVLQVVNAVDPRTRIQSCRLGPEHHRELCPLHRRLDGAIAMVEEDFANTTMAEFVPRPTHKKRFCAFQCVAVNNLFPCNATVASN